MDESQKQLRFNHSSTKHVVTKSKRLALAKVDYTSNDHKIWNGLLGMINPLAEYKRGIEIALTRNEISELTGISLSNVSAACDQASDHFMNTKFEVRGHNTRTGEGEFEKLNLVQKAQYKDGIFLVILTPLASDELLNLSKYGSFDIEHQKNIKSKYAMVLMDILTVNWNRKGRQWQQIKLPVAHLKWQFGLANEKGVEFKKTYKGIRELKRRVITTAVKELNLAGDFIVPLDKISYIKTGNTVTDIIFTVSRHEKVKVTDSSLDYEKRLKKHGLTDEQLEEILLLAKKSWFCIDKPNSEIIDFISESINYVESKSPKSYFSYLKKAIKNAYAFIPDWANPYSDIYKNAEPLLRLFVEQRLAPEFICFQGMYEDGDISSHDYFDICQNGAYSDYFNQERDRFIKQRLKTKAFS